MGQKVNPFLFRLLVSSKKKKKTKTNLWENSFSIEGNNRKSANLLFYHFLIRFWLKEFYSKIGYFYDKISINQSTSFFNINIEVLKLNNLGNKCNSISNSLRIESTYFLFSSLIQVNGYGGFSYKIKEVFFNSWLNFHKKEMSIIVENFWVINKFPFFRDSIAIFYTLSLIETPHIATKYISYVLSNFYRQQFILDYFGNILSFIYSNNVSKIKIKGFLIKVKGRINGSDRSKISTYRSGSVPLQSLKERIVYGFSVSDTIHGKISIKLWIHYDF